MRDQNISICFPRWFIFFYSFSAIVVVTAILLSLIFGSYAGFTLSDVWRPGIFVLIILVAVWCEFEIVLYSVTASDKGLEANKVIGQNKSFTWDEIVELRRPLFRIPVDLAYVVSKSNDKLRLVRSMSNYRELIQIIKVRAPNLNKCKI